MGRRLAAVIIVAAIAPGSGTATNQEAPKLRIHAAASLKDAIDALSQRYQAKTDTNVTAVYAASGTLARQIAQGAPTDLFIPAHPLWLDWLTDKGVGLDERAVMATNRLALIEPRNSPSESGTVAARLQAVANSDKRVAIGHPAYVPAGLYARQALKALGHWEPMQGRLVRAASARATVAAVARGGIAIGLVYRTDARVSQRVRSLGLLPTQTHEPIRYAAALVGVPSQPARAFIKWLTSGPAQAILADHGFKKAP
jgi:molybdate transport system substrate-binding protein